MKNKNILKVSEAAATRIFLKIAAMGVNNTDKSKLMMNVADIIGSRLDADSADFEQFGEAGAEIRAMLTKAISRSAAARAAAARRRKAKESTIETTRDSSAPIVVECQKKEKSPVRRIRIANKRVIVKHKHHSSGRAHPYAGKKKTSSAHAGDA